MAATVQSDAPASATPVLLRDQLQLDSGRLSTQRRAAARRWSWLFHRSIEGHRSIPNCYVTLEPRSDQVGRDATVPAAADERRYISPLFIIAQACAACGTVGPTASPSSASKNTVAEIVKRHRADAGQRQMSFARDEPYHAGNGRGGCQDAIVRAQSRAFSLSVRNTGEACRRNSMAAESSPLLGIGAANGRGGRFVGYEHGTSMGDRSGGQARQEDPHVLPLARQPANSVEGHGEAPIGQRLHRRRAWQPRACPRIASRSSGEQGGDRSRPFDPRKCRQPVSPASSSFRHPIIRSGDR